MEEEKTLCKLPLYCKGDILSLTYSRRLAPDSLTWSTLLSVRKFFLPRSPQIRGGGKELLKREIGQEDLVRDKEGCQEKPIIS